jgi:L-threonylcarbamoyladenylate synthase
LSAPSSGGSGAASSGRAAIEPATPEAIDRAARRLADGGLVALPTETVYGLGADAAQRDAVAAIYTLKGRPADHPLIVHVADLAHARRWARVDARALRLAERFWPGPLTLVLPRADDAPAWACGGQASIGLRCPSHPVARALLERFAAYGGSGIAAPSANRFGKVSPTSAAHVADDLGDDAPLILDGGPCEVGVESTIVDLTRERPVLLRPGRIDRRALEGALGEPLAERDAQAPRASGTLAAHYQPDTLVEAVAPAALAARVARLGGSARIAVWSIERPAGVAHWEPSPADAEGWEARLYDTLRRLDRLGLERILVELPPEGAGWEAVHDRLARAASGG